MRRYCFTPCPASCADARSSVISGRPLVGLPKADSSAGCQSHGYADEASEHARRKDIAQLHPSGRLTRRAGVRPCHRRDRLQSSCILISANSWPQWKVCQSSTATFKPQSLASFLSDWLPPTASAPCAALLTGRSSLRSASPVTLRHAAEAAQERFSKPRGDGYRPAGVRRPKLPPGANVCYSHRSLSGLFKVSIIQ
jgi:hypothetical protein